MDFETWAYPLAVIADRYQGTYSGGRWLAIAGIGQEKFGANVPTLLGGTDDEIPNPWGDDTMAMDFWTEPPNWIAAGSTPDEAIAALKKKNNFGG